MNFSFLSTHFFRENQFSYAIRFILQDGKMLQKKLKFIGFEPRSLNDQIRIEFDDHSFLFKIYKKN